MKRAEFEALTVDDLPAVMELQERMVRTLPDPRWYYTSTAEEFVADMKLGGMLGCWVNGTLIAMGNGYGWP